MRVIHIFVLYLTGSLAMSAIAQTPLAKSFVDMKNSDAAISKPAKAAFINVLVAEMPTIEKDTSTICQYLVDPDPYIRLQASAVLADIVIAAPEHNAVVQFCQSSLLITAEDTAERVKNNSLFVLVMNPAGPPAQAQAVLASSLGSSNLRTAELGAAGLLKINSGTNTANHKAVADALSSAPDANHQLNLLYAIGGSNTASPALFTAVQKFVYDKNPDIQQAAIVAVESTAASKAEAKSVLLNVANSESVPTQTKQQANAALSRIATTK